MKCEIIVSHGHFERNTNQLVDNKYIFAPSCLDISRFEEIELSRKEDFEDYWQWAKGRRYPLRKYIYLAILRYYLYTKILPI